MGSFVVGILLFLVAASVIDLTDRSFPVRWSDIFLLNIGLYLVLFLFDTFFIDAFVLGLWRPAFLKLPPEMGRESMREHIVKSIPVGLLSGVLLAGVSSLVSLSLVN